MTLNNLIEKSLLSEALKPIEGKRGIIVFDIDDTLLTAQNIFIHKIFSDGKVQKLTPDEYAKDIDKKNKTPGIKFSYEEFRDPQKVRDSITTGLPLVRNLKMMDAHIRASFSLAILTARGLEDVVASSLDKFLMFRDADGELKSIKGILQRNMVHAISDETKIYPGTTDFEKKAKVITELAKKYDTVKFVDDDVKNIEAVRNLKLPNVQAIRAWGRE